jgi:hypothetical protein
MANLNDSLKKTIDDLDLDRRLEQLGEFAQKTVADVKAQAGTLAHDKRAKVDELLAKATDALDQRTHGKYHDKAVKFSSAVGDVVDRVAEQRPTGRHASGSPTQPAPTGTANPFPAHPYGSPADGHDGGTSDGGTGHTSTGAATTVAATADSAGTPPTDGPAKPWYAE